MGDGGKGKRKETIRKKRTQNRKKHARESKAITETESK